MARGRNRFFVGVGDLQLTAKDKRLVNQALDRNRLSYGPFSRRLETSFARLHNSKYCILTNSGTSSLHIALAALKERHGWNDGDEVIVPAVTFVATPNVVIHNGLTPVFVDVDPRTFNLDPGRLEGALSHRTRAIMPVHLLGLPAEMGPICAFARKHHLEIVEDSCETMFARYRGRPVGSFGAIGCFSTYFSHFIVTGVGGLTTTSDPELAVILRSLANHGREGDERIQGSSRTREPTRQRFRFVRIGHSFRITELEAALGLSQLSRWRGIVRRRQAIARRYLKGLRELSEHLQLPTVPSDREHVFMQFGLVCKNEDKAELVEYLESHSVETRDLLPLVSQPAYHNLFARTGVADLPAARHLDSHAFYIGCHQYMSNDQVDYVVRMFLDFYRR